MIIRSEKESYRDDFREITGSYNEDIYLWGEDLLDKKLVLYTGKMKEIPEYNQYADRLLNCGLIVVNVQKKKALRCITTRFNSETNRIYLKDDTFNAIWLYLRKSVDLGIRRTKPLEQECNIKSPEGILDFKYLVRKASDPILKNHRIEYQAREQSKEEIQLLGIRQSAIDNKKNLYFYSKLGGYVHDRSCELLREICNEDLVASAELPAGRNYCPKCLRTILIRKACAPNSKEIPVCNHFLTQYGIKTNHLMKFVEEDYLKFHAKTLDEMTVIGKEDTWKIIVTPQKTLQLWHNNYIRTSPTERYMTDGFHNQGLEQGNLKYFLNYIGIYSWQKHLENEMKRTEPEIEETVATTETIKELHSSEEKSLNLLHRIRKYIVHWLK
jgi:hypothetical protein